jgi:hypothetical protein
LPAPVVAEVVETAPEVIEATAPEPVSEVSEATAPEPVSEVSEVTAPEPMFEVSEMAAPEETGAAIVFSAPGPASEPEEDPYRIELPDSGMVVGDSFAIDNGHQAKADLQPEQPSDSYDWSSVKVEIPPLEPTPPQAPAPEQPKQIDVVEIEKGIAPTANDSIPPEILDKLASSHASERSAALAELGKVGGEDAVRLIHQAFDDPVVEVRNAAAHALYEAHTDRAAAFTTALREGTPERRRNIGAALASSGLASDAINNLNGESREKTYDAFSLLFLMARAGENKALVDAIENHQNLEVRLAAVRVLAFSGHTEIVSAFRRLAVRGSLPTEVRSAVMEAIHQISSQAGAEK